MKTRASKIIQTLACWFCLCTIQLLCSFNASGTSGDDFNDNLKDTSKWGPQLVTAHGSLTELNERLNYTCNSSILSSNSADLPWTLSRLPYNADWDIQVDVFNNTIPVTFAVNSVGLYVVSTESSGNGAFLELFSSALTPGVPYFSGFHAHFDTSGNSFKIDTHSGEGVTNGAVRIVFDSTTKVISMFVDIDPSDGYQWEPHASFGIANSDGANGRADWHLSETNQFAILLYGFSNMAITNGQMHLDNFIATGDVPPAIQNNSDPIGSFRFRFPTNDPLVTPIVSVAGNYTGVVSVLMPRAYDIDLAQDESGKLTAMGTIEGIQDKNGSSQLSLPVGTIKTVNEIPTALLRSRFSGSIDGVPVTFSGTAILPIELTDIGGGTNGMIGTGSFKSKVGGVPNAGKDLPIRAILPPGAEDNLRSDWTFQLDLLKIGVQGREQTMASAQVTLPNGDTIVYAARPAHYSAATGYSLTFKGGTNITVNPPALDKKSSLTVKGLKFTSQGSYWQPVNGTITYQFLGQKGTADLMDFVTE